MQYQQALDEWKQKGYRPISISGYRAGDTTRFAAVFSQDDQVKQWIARHDLTSEQLDRLSKDWIAQGYEPIGIAAYPWERRAFASRPSGCGSDNQVEISSDAAPHALTLQERSNGVFAHNVRDLEVSAS